MGLFADAPKYGGQFYRKFSQAFSSKDIKKYFGDTPVAQHGICAGASYNWVKHYLLFPNQLYTNSNLISSRNEIITVQKGLRFRNQSLKNFLILSGMITRHGHLFDSTFCNRKKLNNTAKLFADSEGINLISYRDPDFGLHVVTCYVSHRCKTMYFCDVHKGDVKIPYHGSHKWLMRYLNLFLDKCGSINISHFQLNWNIMLASQAFRNIAKDALFYNPINHGLNYTRKSSVDNEFYLPLI